MRKIFFILFSLAIALSSLAQADKLAEMEQIRSNNAYRYGEARSASFDEAHEEARKNLYSKLKTILISESTLKNEDFSNTTTAITVGAIENLKETYALDGKDYIFMVYVAEKDLQRATQERADLIRDFIETGMSQEKQLNISEALKYYTWAYRMLSLYADKLRISTDGGERDALSWLSNHIPSMLSNISIAIPEEKIMEDPSSHDRYTLTIEATYNGSPVSMLDISYFNGKEQIPQVACKSGEGFITFPDLSAIKTVDMKIFYDYVQEGRNGDPSLQAVYAKGFKKLPFDQRASLKIPLKIKKDMTKRSEGVPEIEVRKASATDLALAADEKPIVKAPRPTIERPFVQDATRFYDKMVKVENAIKSKNYMSVKDLFTTEGFKVFQLMMGSGQVSVAKKDIKYTVEKSGLFIVGKSIPVAVKNGGHISKENIVFRFDSESEKITSVAYALTQRAENDIFRKADWTVESRYALMQFMEDYQTAYSLKRLDFIESIFSDDAVIIVGNVNAKASKRFINASDMKGLSMTKKISYSKYNKDTYIAKLKEDFRKKSYIQLVYEDTVLDRVGNTEGWTNNDVIWVELKQKYYSSNYNDEGYLALQVNLKPTGSLINVRTWTPFFVPIPELKKAFPIGQL